MHPTDYILFEKNPIIPAAALTVSYVPGVVIDTAWKYDQLLIYFSLTKASLTSFEWKVEFSPDNVSWYQESVESYTGSGNQVVNSEIEHTVVAANQVQATQLYRFAIPITDRYVRVSVKGTGTVVGSSLLANAILGIN